MTTRRPCWSGRYRFIPGTWGWELPSGLADAAQHVFWTDRAREPGEPGWETERLDCVPLRDTPALIAAGRIRGSSTAAALLHLLASPPRNHGC